MSELTGRGAAWTEERGTSDEGRRCLKAPPRLAGNTAETVCRREWGRALAGVARLTHDLGLAADAVQEAFPLALDRWAAGPLPPGPAQPDHPRHPGPLSGAHTA